jgi:hypothetical protein
MLNHISDEELDQLFREFERQIAANQKRHEQPYVLDLIKVLRPYGPRGLKRHFAIRRVWELRQPSGLNIPKKFEQAVQSAFNRHNGQSLTFDLPPEDDLFYPVGRKGSGIWAVHSHKVESWLRKKKLRPI